MLNYKRYISRIEYTHLSLSNPYVDGMDECELDDTEYDEEPNDEKTKVSPKRKVSFENSEAKKNVVAIVKSESCEITLAPSMDAVNLDKEEIIGNIKEHLKLEVFNLGSGEQNLGIFSFADNYDFSRLFEKYSDHYSPTNSESVNMENYQFESTHAELTLLDISQHYEAV